MRLHRLAFVVVALVLSAGCGRLAPEEQVRKLAADFITTSLAFSPTTATASGYHEHEGVVLDDLLDDFDQRGIAGARGFYNEEHANADRMAKLSLTPELKADLDVIRLQCEWALLDLDTIQSYRHNPTVYVETIGNAIFAPSVLNYAPEEKRYAQIASRLEKIPAFIKTAKQNLVDSPATWNEVAQEENDGNISLIEQTIRPKVPAKVKTRFDAAAAKAIGALKQFNLFLKEDLSKHTSDWRLGKKTYDEKFRLVLATGDSPAQTLTDAESRLQSIREEMHGEAIALYPKYYAGKKPPEDLNTVVSQVLAKIALEHATPDTYIADAKRDLGEATKFVQDHHLLTLPARSNLQVIPTPEFMRGIYAVGGFQPAPALEPQLGAFYWITPFTPDMSNDRIESKLREYNLYGLKILTVHEAMPGHYVQFEYANDVQPRWQGALRAIFSNGPYVEGWAVYATELMIQQGYQATPEMKLTFGKQMLRVVANTILDIKLQTGDMTGQQAIDLMINDTFQEKEEAEKKLQRAQLSSCQLPTYFVGWRAWDQLRDVYAQKNGAAFHLATFHEKALKEGALPMPILRSVLQP